MSPDDADRALSLVIEHDDAETYGRALWVLAAYLDAGNIVDGSAIDGDDRAWIGGTIASAAPRAPTTTDARHVAALQARNSDGLSEWILSACRGAAVS